VANASVVRHLGGSALASEQDHWEDEVLDDGVVEMMNSQLMNSQFERLVWKAEII
jgi:hypothetical protein